MGRWSTGAEFTGNISAGNAPGLGAFQMGQCLFYANSLRWYMAQTAFIVRVPEAERHVGDLRDRFDPSARLGVPAHITDPFIR
jgi:hypothetical protein